jgi:predicted phosphate transport protein (TIGR00153 family)
MPFAKLLPREEQYFTLFAQMTSYINDAARTLVEMLSHHDGDYQEYVQRIKSIEHACDDLTHNVATRLNQSFITPFDREDIYMMSKALDDVVDLIDGAARAVVMYDIHEITEPAKQLAGVIQRMAVQLHEVVSMLQKPKGVTERLVEIHRLENEGDDIYQRAVGALFVDNRHPLEVIKWKDVYEKLEAAIDRGENVANIIEGVIIKHS